MNSLIQDYIDAGGICDFGVYATTGPPLFNPLYPTTDQCEGDIIYSYDYYSYQYMDYFEYNTTIITTGVCSDDTAAKLATRECIREMGAEPNFIYGTLNTIMYDMCRPDQIPVPLEGLRKQRKEIQEKKAKNETNRITPIGLVLADLPDGLLNTNLRLGRFPNIASKSNNHAILSM